MCSGNLPAAPESADLIAIIHPNYSSRGHRHSQSRSTPLPLSGRLRLSNRLPNITTTEFDFDTPPLEHELLNIQIHQSGQPVEEDNEHNPVLHSFSLDMLSSDSLSPANAGRRLDLGVGGLGIVGRTVSITDANHRLIGQGIVGRI